MKDARKMVNGKVAGELGKREEFAISRRRRGKANRNRVVTVKLLLGPA
jgi:hypothetical protein